MGVLLESARISPMGVMAGSSGSSSGRRHTGADEVDTYPALNIRCCSSNGEVLEE